MLPGAETVDDERLIAKCYAELACVTKEKGEYDESLRYHRKSLEIFERIDDSLSVADSHLNLAEVYKAKGELKQAMSEYEKGLTIYEDVLVDDSNKTSDSGTDGSLNSSSFSDLQHTKALSKSEEMLPHPTLLEESPPKSPTTSRRSSTPSADAASPLIVKLPLSQENLPSISDHPVRTSSEIGINQLLKSHTSSQSEISEDPQDINLLLSSLSIESLDDLPSEAPIQNYETSNTSGLSASALGSKTQFESHTVDDTAKLEKDSEMKIKTNQWLHRTPVKQCIIIAFCVFFVGLALWSVYYQEDEGTNIVFTRFNSSNDDLNEQIRKYLSWRTDRMNRRLVEEFLRQPNIRTRMTIEKFQRLLDLLDLKMILVPR